MRYDDLVARFPFVGLGSVVPLLTVAACSPGSSDAPPQGGSQGDGGGFVVDGGGGAGGAGGAGIDPCEGIVREADRKPLNLYIMMDASSSMAGAKWEAASAGLAAFVTDPGIEDVDAALSFFPRPPGGPPVCDQNAYKDPVVDYGPLPENGTAILDAIAARAPDGFSSPMYPALGGAILRGIDEANAQPGEVSAVLLVTDGKPDGPADTCAGVNPEDPAEVAALAAAGAAFEPPVKTFVIGLPGVDVTVANQIASAGGTEQAIVVGTTDTADNFTEALKKAQGALLSCVYEIPDEVAQGQVGLGSVNVSIAPGGGDYQIVPRNDACEGPGWHFDDPSSPTSIMLCPDSCALIEDDPDAAISIVLGCPTVT